MKKPQIDLFEKTVQRHINQVGFKNKFLRLWGHDGTSLTEKQYYYPIIHPSKVELFKLLGIYKDLVEAQGKMSGIESAWVYLNPKKVDVSTLTDEILIQELEFDIPDGIYTLNITPNVSFQRTRSRRNSELAVIMEDKLGLLEYSDKVALGEYIKSNYDDVLKNYIVEGAEDDATLNLILMYILKGSTSFSCTIKSTEYALTNNVKVIETEEYSESYKYSVKSISMDLEIKQIGTVTRNDPLVKSILDGKEDYEKSKIKNTAKSTNRILGSTLNRKGQTNSVWLNGKLRVSMFDSKELKTKDLIKLLSNSVDTGYKKKEAKWYKKLIGIIVFVVVFYFTGGTAATTFAAFASAFGAATLAVMALSAGMAAWGDETGAAAVGEFSQTVNKVGMVIGIAAIVTTVINTVGQAAAQQVAAEAAKQGVKLSTAEIAKQVAQRSLIDTLKGMVVDYFKSSFMTNLSLEQGLAVTNRLFSMYSKNKIEDLQDRLKSVQQQNAEYAQFEEENRSRDIGKSLIKSHGEMFHQNSVDKYDYMYESWSSPMHIGNIQRTSWKWTRTGDKIDLRDD